MTENGLNISIRWPDKQTDRVLPFGQLTEREEKVYPSHFLKFLFTCALEYYEFYKSLILNYKVK